MIKAIRPLLNNRGLRDELVMKKALRRQMVKDGINGPVLKKLSREISQLNLQLYGHGTQQQRA